MPDFEASKIRQQLLDRRTELNERWKRAGRDSVHRDSPLDADFAEQAVQRENDEVLTAIAASAADELRSIETALERLDHGVYRVCSRCAQSIEVGRLKAQPYATTCIHCATR